MKLEEPAAHPRRELERRQEEKDAAGEDMENRSRRVCREPAIEQRQIRGSLQDERVVAAKSMKDLLPEGLGTRREVRKKDASSERRCHSDGRKEDNSAPEAATQPPRRRPALSPKSLHNGTSSVVVALDFARPRSRAYLSEPRVSYFFKYSSSIASFS